MAFNGVTLADLNGFMKNYDTGTIVPDQFFWNTLYDDLKGSFEKKNFDGDQFKILIQTGFPFTGQAFGESVDIPQPDDLGFMPMYIPLKETIVNAGVTMQSMRRATGGGASWGRVVDLVLRAQRTDFLWLQEICAIGDGTGRLARVSSSAHSGGSIVVTCDNTYSDFGWENVALIKVGMLVEAYNASGLLIADESDGVPTTGSTTTFRVTAVSFGSRDNGAATTGTVTLTCTNDIDSGTNPTRCFDNGAILYLANTRSLGVTDSTVAFGATAANGNPGTLYESTPQAAVACHTSLPMGLVGLIQTAAASPSVALHCYTDDSIDCTLDTFQGLTRYSYPNLKSQVYRGGDFGGTDLTPGDWDLSVISDAISQIETDTGGKVDVLRCSAQLAMAINRRNRTESNITVNVSSTGNQNQNAVGSQYASSFLCPDGRVIPIKVSKTIPRNVLYGYTSEDFLWRTSGDYDFLRLNGEVWDKSYDDRKANFEAPYGGMSNIGAERCDRAFVIQDMADNI